MTSGSRFVPLSFRHFFLADIISLKTIDMAVTGVSLDQVFSQIEQHTSVVPSGDVVIDAQRVAFQLPETDDTVLAWKNTVVTTSNADRVVRLREIANVVRDYTDPPSKIMRDNGLPAVIIGVSALPGENIAEGKPRFDAVVDSAANLVRPVMMGSLTTVLGVVPLFLDAFLNSMAVVLVFGLSFATLLTLLIVPALYMVFFRIRLDETART